MVKVISLTGTLAYAGKYGVAAVLSRDITDQLLNQNGLAHAGAAEQPDLTALLVRAEQIHHLDAGLQQFFLRSLLLDLRRRSVDRLIGYPFRGRFIINWLTQNIEDPP